MKWKKKKRNNNRKNIFSLILYKVENALINYYLGTDYRWINYVVFYGFLIYLITTSINIFILTSYNSYCIKIRNLFINTTIIFITSIFVFLVIKKFLEKANKKLLNLSLSIFFIILGIIIIFQLSNSTCREVKYFFITLLTPLIFYSYISQRFFYSLLTSLFLTITYALIFISSTRNDKEMFIEIFLFIVIENLLGIPLSYLKDRVLKNEIILSRILANSNKQLKEYAYLDKLTNIYNRRYFEEIFEKEWKRGIKTKHPISLLMIDIDHFKQYNDILGHLKGDLLLKEIARTITDSVRSCRDIVARYGGEEFVVILLNTDIKKAREIAERIRKNIENRHIEHPASKVSKYVTVSIGVASIIPKERQPKEILIKMADEALYKAKRKGKNRVEIYEL